MVSLPQHLLRFGPGEQNLPTINEETRAIMDPLESTTQSFIVKVWVEEGGQGAWHGHITQVPSGKRRYLKNLAEIQDFIAPHLEEMGVKLGKRWRIIFWLKHLIGQG